MKTTTAFLLLSAVPLFAADESARLLQSWRLTDAKTQLTAAGIKLMLPADAQWTIAPQEEGAPVSQLQLSISQMGGPQASTSEFAVIGLVKKDAKPFTLRLQSVPPGRTCTVEWDPSKGEKKDDLLKDWARSSALHYAALRAPRGSITDRWARTLPALFGGDPVTGPEFGLFSNDNEVADPMDTLAVFGGRCAVAETLQLRDIDQPDGGPPQAKKYTQPVPISELPAVNVKSHPFAEMAKQNAANPAPLELASLCPPDRFFAYFPQPRRLRTVIEQLGGASDQLSAPTTDGATDYRLWQKYLTRMGLNEETVRAWLDGGHAESVAFTLPDLFLRDGTDITFLIRMKDANAPLLFSVMPETDAVLTVPGATGQCHIARRGQVLIASTSRAEAELALKLADSKGTGSLGASDELRCMRQRLPDSAATIAWCYFSDAFIRRLTGPEVKIGQHRRLVAREKMESLTAAALLYRSHHGIDAPDAAALTSAGYAAGFKPGENRWSAEIPRTEAENTARFTGLTLKGYTAHSETWGTLAELSPLSAQPVTTATAEEATMYASYVARYQDYWRRYFDPIAIRLDESAPGTWSLSTLVLPLVDNSLYTGLKEALDTTRPAALPVLDPPPVAAIAFAVKHDALSSGMLREIQRHFPIADALTGRIAFAVPDADPVFQTGGIAGLQQMGSLIGGRNELGGIGLAISMLTRPFDIFLESTDETKALALLDSVASASASSFIKLRRVTREGENRRIYVFDFDGFAQLHISATMENGWLHLSNHPWSGAVRVTGTEPAARGSAFIRLNPAALKSGNPAAVFQAQNQRRQRTFTAAAELIPWMETLGLDTTKAAAEQYTALGLSTPLPSGTAITSTDPLSIPGLLTDKGEILSAADAQKDPGILNGIQSVELFTSLEEDGLRATLEWKTAP